MGHALFKDRYRLNLAKVIQRLQFSTPLEKDPPLQKVWQGFRELIIHMLSRRNSEDVVKFL